jgi:hypothetical protein
MPLPFINEIVRGLPPLAWLFELTTGGIERLIHGSAVSAHGEGFIEGCVAAEAVEAPQDATNIFGSGLSTAAGTWLFVTPSHTLEALYLYRHSQGWSISNSLAFLVSHHQIVPPWDLGYGARFATLCRGIDAYERRLFRTQDGELLRVVYDNIELSSNGDFQLIRKPLPPPFTRFEDYVAYLQETLGSALADAMNPDRGPSYPPLATCSTGYDSASVAALAAPLGCTEAVTLRTARGGQADSGKAIGELLGLRVREVERPSAVEGGFHEVADFLATGMGGEDYCLTNFGPHLRRRTLLTGYHGDCVWALHKTPGTVFARNDLSGFSLQEFRLWNDFIHIPAPTIGTRRDPEIHAISRAPEMAAYRLVENHYDRPIPRRILEEAGVPRSLFGQQKRAASTLLFLNNRLLGPVPRRELEGLLSRPWFSRGAYKLARASWGLRQWGFKKLSRHDRTFSACEHLRQALVSDWRIFEHSHPRASLQFVAGLLVVARRYRDVLQAHQAGRTTGRQQPTA